MSTDLKQTIIRIEPEQHDLLKTYSVLNNVSMSEIIRNLIEENRESFAHGIELKINAKRKYQNNKND